MRERPGSIQGGKTTQAEMDFDINRFAEDIRARGLSNFMLRDLLKPDGYAEKVVKKTQITNVQLRRVFTEFKNIYNLYRKKGGVSEEIQFRLYKLYPLINYQCNRGLVTKDFRKLIISILDSLERDFEKNIEVTIDFMEAIVAYAPRDTGK